MEEAAKDEAVVEAGDAVRMGVAAGADESAVGTDAGEGKENIEPEREKNEAQEENGFSRKTVIPAKEDPEKEDSAKAKVDPAKEDPEKAKEGPAKVKGDPAKEEDDEEEVPAKMIQSKREKSEVKEDPTWAKRDTATPTEKEELKESESFFRAIIIPQDRKTYNTHFGKMTGYRPRIHLADRQTDTSFSRK